MIASNKFTERQVEQLKNTVSESKEMKKGSDNPEIEVKGLKLEIIELKITHDLHLNSEEEEVLKKELHYRLDAMHDTFVEKERSDIERIGYLENALWVLNDHRRY